MELIKLEAQARERKGSRESRKLRRTGFIPAVVYGHKQESATISLPADAFLDALKAGGRLFTLKTTKGDENAFIAEMQHDTLTDAVIHVDFTRVDMNEQISLEVAIKLKGTPTGVVKGGLLEEMKAHTRVRCLPTAIPKHIEIDISSVEIGHALYLKDLALPAGVTLDEAGDHMVVRVVEKVEEVAAPAAAAATPVQPEVIAKKKEEETEE